MVCDSGSASGVLGATVVVETVLVVTTVVAKVVTVVDEGRDTEGDRRTVVVRRGVCISAAAKSPTHHSHEQNKKKPRSNNSPRTSWMTRERAVDHNSCSSNNFLDTFTQHTVTKSATGTGVTLSLSWSPESLPHIRVMISTYPLQ